MPLIRNMKIHWEILKLTLRSLSHDTCRLPGFYTDALFEPVFWIVDHFAGLLGLVFVVLVTLLISTVVGIWYIFLFPIISSAGQPKTICHVIYAHWLLVNILFHYFQSVTTDPGLPPQGEPMDDIKGAVICKKCIQPKPPRAHHCSVCNRCVLKMDHHCPWMNNCIGFYNHRYFISFCCFMWLGTVYVCLSSWDAFVYHFFNPELVMETLPIDMKILPHNILNDAKREATTSLAFGLGTILDQVYNLIRINSTSGGKIYKVPHPSGIDNVHPYEHIAIIYLFLLCSAVTVALGLLNLWHLRLVFTGQTSIEIHINRTERKKANGKGMVYHNPHDFGYKQNIKNLLGLSHGRSLVHVLLPSNHKPSWDGSRWPPNPWPTLYYDPAVNRKLSVFTRLRRLLTRSF